MTFVILQVIGWAGSVLLVISLLVGNPRRFRLLNLISSLILVAYNAALPVPNWPMAAMNAAIVVINFVKFRQLLRQRHGQESPNRGSQAGSTASETAQV